MSQLLFFILMIGPIIFVHEMGHFAVAKAFGMKVLTFSLGFGKRIWGFKRGETEYRLAILPLGGYVRLSGEDDVEVTDDPRDFGNRPRWQRIAVYLAGPAMNAVFSIGIVAVLFMIGIDVPTLSKVPPVVGTVVTDSPGDRVGLRPGDVVVSVDGDSVEAWQDVAFAIATSANRSIRLTVDRTGTELSFDVVPIKPEGLDYGDAGLIPRILPKIGRVLADSPAEKSGFQIGDEVIGVDGKPIFGTRDFVEAVSAKPEQDVRVELRRAGRPLELTVVPELTEGRGRIGVHLAFEQRLSLLPAIVESVHFNYGIVKQTLAAVRLILTGKLAMRDAFQGPLRIAEESDEAAKRGSKDFFFLIALISISIGLLNMFPIPILDGGNILILIVESVIRRDLPVNLKERFAQVGLVLILLLMASVIWFDASRKWFSD